MAETSYPFDGSAVATEIQWARMAGRWGINGVHANTPGSTNLKVTANGTSSVSVAAGRAYVNGFFYRADAAVSVPVTSNSGGSSARVDLVVLRCDQSANSITVQYKTGGSVAPALDADEAGIYEIPLAQCTVAAGASAVTAVNCVDTRWFTGKSVCPSIPSQRRPSIEGLMLVEGNDLYLGDGTGWNYVATAGGSTPSTYTPVWTAGTTAISWGSGTTNIGRYRRLPGGLCWVAIQLIPGGNPAADTDPIGVTLPLASTSAYRSLFQWNFTSANGEGEALGGGMTFPTTDGPSKIARLRYPTGTPDALNMLVNSPFNIRAGDVLTITGTYELA